MQTMSALNERGHRVLDSHRLIKVDRDVHNHLLNFALKKLLVQSPDVTIFTQDGQLEMSRLLLLMYSPTLSSALSQLTPFSSILLPDYSIASVRALIDLLVSGSSSGNHLSAQDFGDVLEMAKDLQIQMDNNNIEMIENKSDNMVTGSGSASEIQDDANDFTFPNDSASDVAEKDFEDNLGYQDNIKVEVAEDGDGPVFLVRCKETWGEFHQDKFVSGGKGLCILFKEQWMTPNDFERLAGSKARKYKESLYVNGKALKTLIDPNGSRMATPSVKQKKFSTLIKTEASKSSLVTPVKGQRSQGSISQYFTPKLKKKENNLEEYRDEIGSPEENKSRIADIADSKKRKRQSSEPNDTGMTQVKHKKMGHDLMPEVGAKHVLTAKLVGEAVENEKDDFTKTSDDFQGDDGNCYDSPLMIDLDYADNCQPPVVSKSNAKQIIDNVFQELMESVQFQKESSLKKDSNETSTVNFEDRPVTKKIAGRYSEEQTSGLCNAFNEGNYLTKEKAQELSKDLCLTENQIRDWFKKARAKSKALTYKTDDKLKVKTEIVEEIEHHMEQIKVQDGVSAWTSSNIQGRTTELTTDEKVNRTQKEIENLFKAYDNVKNQCTFTCDCGLAFKNTMLLKFHKHICPTAEANVKDAPKISKEESSAMDGNNKDDTLVHSNDFPVEKNRWTCECGLTFKNSTLLKYHQHVCQTTKDATINPKGESLIMSNEEGDEMMTF